MSTPFLTEKIAQANAEIETATSQFSKDLALAHASLLELQRVAAGAIRLLELGLSRSGNKHKIRVQSIVLKAIDSGARVTFQSLLKDLAPLMGLSPAAATPRVMRALKQMVKARYVMFQDGAYRRPTDAEIKQV